MADRKPRASRTRATTVPEDPIEVRVFTLADHAVVAPDGKLYMNGGGVAQQFLRQLPGPLGPLSLALVVRLPWHMTSDSVKIAVRALDADRNAVGPDPVFDADAEVGRAPGQRPGDEITLALAVPLGGYEVRLPSESTVYFHLIVNGEPLTRLPLKLRRLPVAGPALG
jgi:hypothetical protein